MNYTSMKKHLFFLLIILYIKTYSQDTIVVQIAHGSKPRKQYINEQRTIGGYKGGHVVIQIDQTAYGFFFKGHRIHIFPHLKRNNGIFQQHTIQEWVNITKDKKVTKIFIPLSAEEKQQLLRFYQYNLIKPAYDYSFFGQRCASSAYGALKMVHKIKRGSYLFNAFHPAQLRKKIIKQNKERGYKIIVKPGSNKRKWEGIDNN